MCVLCVVAAAHPALTQVRGQGVGGSGGLHGEGGGGGGGGGLLGPLLEARLGQPRLDAAPFQHGSLSATCSLAQGGENGVNVNTDNQSE